MIKDYEDGRKKYKKYYDEEVKQGKSILPFVIFLVGLFLGFYIFFNNYFF